MRRIQTALRFTGTACTNVGRFSRSWDVRFDQRGTGRLARRQDFGCVSNNERL
jgi:hypothetical protein